MIFLSVWPKKKVDIKWETTRIATKSLLVIWDDGYVFFATLSTLTFFLSNLNGFFFFSIEVGHCFFLAYEYLMSIYILSAPYTSFSLSIRESIFPPIRWNGENDKQLMIVKLIASSWKIRSWYPLYETHLRNLTQHWKVIIVYKQITNCKCNWLFHEQQNKKEVKKKNIKINLQK